MPKIEVNDINIYYEVYGEGFPLVMIIGLSANIDWWTKDVIESLAEDFKLVIFDNRGTGKTSKTDIDFSIKMLADDTAGLMDALGFKRFHVLGISMGGMIAQELTLNYPERIEKLILGCTNCGGSKQIPPSAEVIEILRTPKDDMTPEELINGTIPLLYTENFIKNNPDFIEYYKQELLKSPIAPDIFQRQVKAILNFNICLKLKKVTVPTLIIHGKKDILIPYENADIIAKRIPNSKVILLDNSAHIFFQPDSAKVINYIKEFLK